jgi:hypothetical protein
MADNPAYRQRKTREPGVDARKPGQDLVRMPTIKIPRELAKRIDYETDRRMISRAMLVSYLLEIGLDHLPPVPGDA